MHCTSPFQISERMRENYGLRYGWNPLLPGLLRSGFGSLQSIKKTGVEIVYSADGILPACTPLVVDWIVAQTNKWVESKR